MMDRYVIQVYIKIDSQILEIGLQTSPLSFFRNQFLKVSLETSFYKISMDLDKD
jgi:hypothetical protein